MSFSLTAGLRGSVDAAGGPPHPDRDCGFPHTVFPGGPDPFLTMLADAEADVRATTVLLDLIIGRMDAGKDN